MNPSRTSFFHAPSPLNSTFYGLVFIFFFSPHSTAINIMSSFPSSPERSVDRCDSTSDHIKSVTSQPASSSSVLLPEHTFSYPRTSSDSSALPTSPKKEKQNSEYALFSKPLVSRPESIKKLMAISQQLFSPPAMKAIRRAPWPRRMKRMDLTCPLASSHMLINGELR